MQLDTKSRMLSGMLRCKDNRRKKFTRRGRREPGNSSGLIGAAPAVLFAVLLAENQAFGQHARNLICFALQLLVAGRGVDARKIFIR